jgi:hypothetical protein
LKKFKKPGRTSLMTLRPYPETNEKKRPTDYTARPAAATKEAGKLRSWEAGKKHENCVRFSACSEIMVRKKIAENPHHRIDTTVTEIKCCNKNKKLNDCSTDYSDFFYFF